MTNTNILDYFKGLSREELIQRKKSHYKTYLFTTAGWLLALVLTMYFASIEMPLLILYAGAVITTIISLWFDYRNRIKMIDKILESK